jgi:glycosyltransferase involved in cell wall biosynthesis
MPAASVASDPSGREERERNPPPTTATEHPMTSPPELSLPENLRVALVHDWLFGMRGGEKVLEELCRMFPAAEIFTLFHRRGSVSPTVERRPIHVSVLGRLPKVHRYYRWLLPLMPNAIEQMRLRDFDLVISSSHCVALGARVPQGALHVCYCHSPMRYVWDQFDDYFGSGRSSLLTRSAARLLRSRLRRWDAEAGRRPHVLIANSRFVAERIGRCYGRTAEVVYPGVDTDYYSSVRQARRNVALMVTALVPYKRIELALEAFETLPLPLVIIGSGPRYRTLRRLAGPNASFLGWQQDEILRRYYSESKLLVFPGVEDFGMVPVEAMACGLPVVAFGQGGALESVEEPQTGVFFHEPKAASLAEAVRRALELPFDPQAIRARALRFSRTSFVRAMTEVLARSFEMKRPP